MNWPCIDAAQALMSERSLWAIALGDGSGSLRLRGAIRIPEQARPALNAAAKAVCRPPCLVILDLFTPYGPRFAARLSSKHTADTAAPCALFALVQPDFGAPHRGVRGESSS